LSIEVRKGRVKEKTKNKTIFWGLCMELRGWEKEGEAEAEAEAEAER